MTTLAEIEAAALALPEEDRFKLMIALEDAAGEPPPPDRVITADTPLSTPGLNLTAEELNRVIGERLERHRRDPSAAQDAFEFLDELDAEDAAEAEALAAVRDGRRAA